MSKSKVRYVGIDLHKHYVMVAAVDAHKQIVLRPTKVGLVEFETWAQKQLRPTDEVVFEATTNAWYLYDLLIERVARIVVAHPPHVKLIAASLVKTDKKDARALAKLLAVDLIPAVWVPPEHVRELRALIAHRQRLISQQTQIKNRLQSVLHRHHIVPPGGKLFSQANRAWWQGLDLSLSEKLRVRQDLVILDQLEPLVKEVRAELERLSLSAPWTKPMPYLLQLPGLGLITAMTILSAIGDISRFPTAKKLVGYAGLGARVHASGQTYKTGGITKTGRKELRYVLVEASWTAIRYNADWRQRFTQLERRIGREKAIVAIARKLLVVIWHVLTKQEPDRQADPEQVARYFIRWGRDLRVATHFGLTAAQFARQQLDRIGIGQELTRVVYGNCNYCLPPSQLPTSTTVTLA